MCGRTSSSNNSTSPLQEKNNALPALKRWCIIVMWIKTLWLWTLVHPELSCMFTILYDATKWKRHNYTADVIHIHMYLTPSLAKQCTGCDTLVMQLFILSWFVCCAWYLFHFHLWERMRCTCRRVAMKHVDISSCTTCGYTVEPLKCVAQQNETSKQVNKCDQPSLR